MFSGIFVWKVCSGWFWFVPLPLLSEYIRNNIKFNITFNFRFHMYITHALYPPPPVTNCHTLSDPSPSNVTYFMDGPIDFIISDCYVGLLQTVETGAKDRQKTVDD